jgi:hypothetical protein
MKKLDKPLFTDKRKKPVTIKGTKTKAPKKLSSMAAPTTDMSSDMPMDMSSSTPAADASAPTFKSGGMVHRGQGAVIKFKTTKYC